MTHDIEAIRRELLGRIEVSDTPRDVLRAAELRDAYSSLGSLAAEERGAFGKSLNELKNALEAAIEAREASLEDADV